MILIESPTVARLPPGSAEVLKDALEYQNLAAGFDYRRFQKQAYRFANDPEEYARQLEVLRRAQVKSLLFSDERGYWTYSGLAGMAARYLNCGTKRSYDFPTPAALKWKREPEHAAWPHQVAAKEALLAVRHGAVEIAPGLGKSDIIEALVREVGLKAVVGAPSLSIAQQLREQLAAHLGESVVGSFYDGCKQSDRRVVVGTSGSLLKVAPGSRHWKDLSSASVFVCDESHLWAADCLSKIALELLAHVPYRWFFSGTQLRADGAGLLLEGIIGPVVYSMTTREGVEGGYLAAPRVRIVEVGSKSGYSSSDADRMTRAHLYFNPEVNAAAAALANRFVSDLKRPTLVLVDEVEQFARLLPLFRHPVAFAHGPLQETVTKRGQKVAGNAAKVPEFYRESDPKRLVAEFNEGKWPILVGTSCISTGTDLRANEATIYLVGNKSEVAVKQALGRNTRGGEKRNVRNPWTGKKKTDCYHVDFLVNGVPMMERHLAARRKFYREVASEVEQFAWGAA